MSKTTDLFKTWKSMKKKEHTDKATAMLTELTSELMNAQDQVWEQTQPKKSKNRMDIPVVRRKPVKGQPKYITRMAVKSILPMFIGMVEDLNAEFNLDYRKVFPRRQKTKVTRKNRVTKVSKKDKDRTPF